MRFVFALLCCLFLSLSISAGAQETAGKQVDTGTPLGVETRMDAGPQATAAGVAGRTLSGVVTDTDGALVPGAKVLLRGGSGRVRSAVTDAAGHFSFGNVAVGAFTVTVAATGMEGATARGSLNVDESLELPAIALKPAVSDEVEVSGLTQQEVAEKQVKQEEKQRLVGLVPNFYVSYTWDAAPLTPKQKFKLAARSIVDPATFVINAGFSGIEQATNEFSGYGQGWEGYGKRYGAGMADTSIGGMLGGWALPVLFHQDPRYFYKGTGTKWHRALYAISTAVIARGDNGKWQPAYASVLGDFASGAISNLYYPASDRNGAELTIVNGCIDVASDAAGNLLQEFLLKKLSKGVKGQGAAHP
ncbi:MAG: carboxypeptidase-like regulatory domain-containing protein [Acidobacteriaceae bacterium]